MALPAGHVWAAGAVAAPPIIQGKATAVATDDTSIHALTYGYTYVVGSFSGTVDFDPSGNVDLKTSVGGSVDAYVSCFRLDGSYAWTKTFGGSGDDKALAMAVVGGGVNGNGTLYVVGYFSSANAGMNGPGALSTRGANDAFVISLNGATGEAVDTFGTGGIQTFGGTGTDVATGACISGNGLYVCGHFDSGDAQVGGAGATASTLGLADAFVLALDRFSGQRIPAFGSSGVQIFGGTKDDMAYGIATDGGGHVFITGEFSSEDAGVGAVGPLPPAANSISASGGTGEADAYILSLKTADGGREATFNNTVNPLNGHGVVTFRGGGRDVGRAICFGNNSIYITGEFSSSDARVGGMQAVPPGVAWQAHNSAGGKDCFILAIGAASGTPVTTFNSSLPADPYAGVRTFGGSLDEVGTGIFYSTHNPPTVPTLFITGYFNSSDAWSYDLSGPVLPVPIRDIDAPATHGGFDAFVIALNPTTG